MICAYRLRLVISRKKGNKQNNGTFLSIAVFRLFPLFRSFADLIVIPVLVDNIGQKPVSNLLRHSPGMFVHPNAVFGLACLRTT
jgi:hypothetical protein